jgi:hypothetical protein
MGRRSIDYSKLQALEDERKLMVLDAKQNAKDRSPFDPTAEIPGTAPEKLVFNYLVKLKIPFEFQYHLYNLPSTSYPESYWIPDFMIPAYNILLEVYGSYWHSILGRRDQDQLKKVYWLNMGYVVVENGIPLYPSSGSAIGKAVIWWEWEIYLGLDQLISRDLPELINAERIKGEPEEYILDAELEKLSLVGQQKGGAARKIRPKINPIDKQIRLLRKQLFNINSLEQTYVRRGRPRKY